MDSRAECHWRMAPSRLQFTGNWIGWTTWFDCLNRASECRGSAEASLKRSTARQNCRLPLLTGASGKRALSRLSRFDPAG